MDIVSYILSKKYTDKALEGAGALKGANCTIKSIVPINGGNRVTFEWTENDGTVTTDTMDVMDGEDDIFFGTEEEWNALTEEEQNQYNFIFTTDDEETFCISIPEGGTAGQVLVKKSGEDYDAEWKNAEGSDIDDGKASADTVYSSEKVTNLLGNKVFVGKKTSGTLIDGIFVHTNGNSYASTHWKVFVIPIDSMASINVGGRMTGTTKTQVSKYRWAFYDTLITAENYSTTMTSSHCVAIAPCDGGVDIGTDISAYNWDDLLQIPTTAKCCVISVPNSLVSYAFINEGISFDYADKSCITVMNAEGITSDVTIKFDALGIAKNTILDIVSMYSGETQPNVIGKTSLVTTKAYPISDVGFYKRNTLRYPYELKGERNIITITVPSGTTLNIKEMAIKFADERFDTYGAEMICHNGVNQMCPENTAPAFEWAGKLGYKRLITQMQVTSDGEVVCIHDGTINRTARNMDGTTISETITVSEHTYAELCQYDYGIKKDAYWAKTKLPTFDEYLDICAAYGMMPEISMHIGNMGANAWAKVKSALEKRNMVDKITFKAFNGSILQYAWDVFGDTVRGYGIDVGKDGSISDKITELETVIGQNYSGKKFVELQRTNVDSTNVNTILSAGYECHVWDISTLWEVSDYINAINLGVSAFTDDYNWQNGMLWK
jgi:glycerophosphoryl diester phosphodiesterase